MNDRNDHADRDGSEFGLVSRTLGGLPIVGAVLDRLGLPALLSAALPAQDGRLKLAPAVAIRLVVTNLVLGREPLYGLGEWAARHDPALLGLTTDDLAVLNDDRVGRALEALFDADRASLLTAVVLRAHIGAGSGVGDRTLVRYDAVPKNQRSPGRDQAAATGDPPVAPLIRGRIL